MGFYLLVLVSVPFLLFAFGNGAKINVANVQGLEVFIPPIPQLPAVNHAGRGLSVDGFLGFQLDFVKEFDPCFNKPANIAIRGYIQQVVACGARCACD